MPSQDPQDLLDHLDSQELLAALVSKEIEDFQEHLVLLAHLVPPDFKVLQDSLERKVTLVMPSQSVV